MDGVISDFDKAFGTTKFDSKLFTKRIYEDKIFETLDWMFNGGDFLIFVQEQQAKYGFDVEILSSLGTPNNTEQQNEVAKQKTIWLHERNINIKQNYVTHKGKKKLFATPKSILVDDTQQNVYDFNEESGHAFLYEYDKPAQNKENFMILLANIINSENQQIFGR
jgi:hypothetical protein